ncbi:MAG TPA: hypothetical protein VMS30_07460 [Phycisphaerales bacterium]|nr:hypothetical protein [Phycisphaerales bacterium]
MLQHTSSCLRSSLAGRTVAMLVAAGICMLGMAQAPPGPDVSVEDEVLGNLRNQAIGRQTLADLNLPEAFLRREADRIIRASFDDRYRIVVKDPLATTADGQPPMPYVPMNRRAIDGAIDLYDPPLTAEMLAYRKSLQKGRPSNRGFMPALTDAEPRWHMDEPGGDAPPPLRAAADLVGKRLAFDGLLPTLARVMATLGPATFATVEDADVELLRATGLPVDLLRHFQLGSGESDRDLLAALSKRLAESPSFDAINAELSGARFVFKPTRPGFVVADDSGSVEPGVIRGQITRGGYWRGEGDGATTDLVRLAAKALPKTPFVLSVDVKHAREFADVAATWPLTMPKQVTLVPEPLRIEQWTQDNSKAGTIGEDAAATALAMLVPRYACWGDDGSTFLPGEMFLLPGAAAAIGAELIHSPLLFQGGNILCVIDPKTGERLLLVADADIYRNTALGLTAAQATEAFRVEFGCDRCEMIEAASFHLDYDVSVRAVNGRLVALMNDPLTAAIIMLEAATAVLVRAGVVPEAAARDAVEALRGGDHRGYLDRIAPAVYARGPDGRFPLSLAERFATSPVDSGVGNLQRFLLALDLLISRDLKPQELPGSRHARSSLMAMQREEAQRQALHQRLRDLGMDIVSVPNLVATSRGMACLNGLQLKGMYVMPAYGGLYAATDVAAKMAIAAAFGPDVHILQIECGESQRRSGAVRCSLAVFPKLPAATDAKH